ncbi:hypothetical protein DV737_g5300, partial [Chaetothyriales sp. CBS 132003]
MSLQEQHDRDVARICEQVKKFHSDQKHFRIYHGSSGSTRPIAFQAGSYIDTSMLNRTFPVDKAKKTIKVEPKIHYDELVAATLKEGYMPLIVPELKALTVGGGFAGTAGESSSYLYGMFEQIVTEIEIVLGDGSLTTASKTFQPDLLEWAGSSMGTLGIVTLLEVQLTEAKKYVQLDIQRVEGLKGCISAMEAAIANPSVGYIDGIMFDKSFGAVMSGRAVDDNASKLEIRSFHTRNDPWFTNYIDSVAKNKRVDPIPSILIPITDYFFRYDRGVFWGGKLAFDYFHMPFNRLTRWALDAFMGSRVCYHALHEGGFASKYIVQDFTMPRSSVEAFVEYVSKIMPCAYEFFVCPIRSGNDLRIMNKVIPPGGDKSKADILANERLYNVGVYGKGMADPDAFVELNRQLEHKLWYDFSGLKMLYARSYYTPEEFLAIYNREPYDAVRAKYHAEGLPNVYDKISADMNHGRKPPTRFPGLIGASRAFLGLISQKRRTSYLIDHKASPGSEETTKTARKDAEKGFRERNPGMKVVNGYAVAEGANGHAKPDVLANEEKSAVSAEHASTTAAHPVVNGEAKV